MTVVLDTNVISEAMKKRPDPRVIGWLGGQNTDEVSVTAITVEEVLFGLGIMPDSARREDLTEAFQRVMLQLDILGFGEEAASICAEVRAVRRRSGQPIHLADAQIVSIAKLHGAAIATRDIGGFEGCGVELINPWDR